LKRWVFRRDLKTQPIIASRNSGGSRFHSSGGSRFHLGFSSYLINWIIYNFKRSLYILICRVCSEEGSKERQLRWYDFLGGFDRERCRLMLDKLYNHLQLFSQRLCTMIAKTVGGMILTELHKLHLIYYV